MPTALLGTSRTPECCAKSHLGGHLRDRRDRSCSPGKAHPGPGRYSHRLCSCRHTATRRRRSSRPRPCLRRTPYPAPRRLPVRRRAELKRSRDGGRLELLFRIGIEIASRRRTRSRGPAKPRSPLAGWLQTFSSQTLQNYSDPLVNQTSRPFTWPGSLPRFTTSLSRRCDADERRRPSSQAVSYSTRSRAQVPRRSECR